MSVAAVVNAERINAELAQYPELFKPVGDVARIAVEEEDGEFRVMTTGQEPTIDADPVGSGEGDILVGKPELVGGLVDLSGRVIEHARFTPAQPEDETCGNDHEPVDGHLVTLPHAVRRHIAQGKSID